MKKIVTVVGARPQIIKSAALTRAIENDSFFQEIKIHTQQHSSESMSGQLFSDLKIKLPDVMLEAPSGNSSEQIAHMTASLQKAFQEHKPDMVVLYGDTNSTLAGALAADKLQIPIAHIEAGLRSFNSQMPEEINRIATDKLSTLLFTPTAGATQQLQIEGYKNTSERFATAANPAVIECGDVMLDNALYYSNGIVKKNKNYIFLTLHRPSNVDNPEFLLPFLQELVRISIDLKKELHFAIHPRTAASLDNSELKEEWEQLKLNDNFILFPPFNYTETLEKLAKASLVWTDSGGLCKEAYYMRTPCLILRSETEWTELESGGYAKVVHNDLNLIKFQSQYFFKKGMPEPVNLYGNGKASEVILASIKSFFCTIAVYSEIDSPRLSHALKALFKPVGVSVFLVKDKTEFDAFKGAKLIYSENAWDNHLHIPPSSFFEDDSIIKSEQFDFPFEVPENGAFHFNFDVLAASFILLSRYEEEVVSSRDAFGRFESKNSLLSKRNWLERPMVDEWRLALLRAIHERFPFFDFSPTSHQVQLTVDVDSAYAYLHKGMYRTAGGFAKDVVKFQFGNLFRRTLVLLRLREDDYNTYDYIASLQEKSGFDLTYFFLLANFGAYDKNVPYTSKSLQHLIQSLSKKYRLGIHPGLASHESLSTLKEEIRRLQFITEKKVLHARMHYLKINGAETYRNLLQCEIENDYTMGFADVIGFKSGTALPHYWYDFKHEKETALLLHPFVAMDATLNRYMKLSAQEAIDKLKALKHTCSRLQVPFCLLWHNESFSECNEWKGWKEVVAEVMR